MASIDENIKKAREFAERALKRNNSNPDDDDYIMFLISKFLLLKENIIEKNADKKELYFNYEINSDYLTAIKYIVDYIKTNNGVINSNNLEVIIHPSSLNNDEQLKSYIRDFHKIRDSIAHGKYVPDSQNGLIIIDNTNLIEGEKPTDDTYTIRAIIPIQVLEIFEYMAINPRVEYDEKEIQKYIKQTFETRKKYNYIDYDIINEEYNNNIIKEFYKINKYYKNSNNINVETINNDHKDNKSTKNLIIDKENNKTNNNYNDNDKYIINNSINKKNYNYINNNNYYENKDFNYYIIKNKEINNSISLDLGEKDIIINNKKFLDYKKEIKDIIDFVEKNNSISQEIKQKIYTLLSKYGIAYYDNNGKRIKLNLDRKPTNSLIDKMKNVINEMASILGIKNKENKEAIVAVYNYLQTLLSFKKDIIEQSSDEDISLGKLKFSRLNPKFLVTENQVDSIKNKIKLSTKRINKMIKQYQEHKTINQREIIMTEFKKLYEELLVNLSLRNKTIITSIRNSIEHGHFNPNNCTIELYDQSNPKDNSTTKFKCYGSPEDFFAIFKKIELSDKNNDFTFTDFLEEIEYILKDDYSQIYLNFINLIQAIRKINEEALLDILKEERKKKS